MAEVPLAVTTWVRDVELAVTVKSWTVTVTIAVLVMPFPVPDIWQV
jgi:hypothetical protein